MSSYKFTTGDIDESISIMREAAQWLNDKKEPMWSFDELNRDVLRNPAQEFIVMYGDNSESIATLLLSYEDNFFYPDIPRDTSGFIHKLAVRRKYAGKGLTNRLIEYAVSICKEKGIASIRLDCDPHRKKLCAFYESFGFELTDVKRINTRRLGEIDIAFYKYNFD